MKVLSLFDGISCGLVALKRAGIPVSRYVAYEIDKYAKIVSKFNHPEIEQRGNVEGADWREFIGFDMVIGGFPCTDLSIAGKRKGLKGDHSSLFWEQVTAIEIIKPKYFLVENNYGMPKKAEDIITEVLGVKPILINSALVSAQQRKRLYWTNIPNLEQPEDKVILLKDILIQDGYPNRAKIVGRRLDEDGVRKEKNLKIPLVQCLEVKKVNDKCACLTTVNKDTALSRLEPGTYKDAFNLYREDFRYLHPIERERLQTLPDHYTELLSDNKRCEVTGLCWTVDVIAHIFRQILLNEIM